MSLRSLAVLAVCVAPLSFSQKAATPSHSDISFMKDAAEGGLDEVKLGQLAQQKGASDKVKMFGQRMVTDHSKANNELQMLAQQKNITLPSDISSKQKSNYKTLSEKSGNDFDKAYITAMVKDHEEDVAAFQKEANNGTDADVKAFAAKTLPTLQEHLRLAQSIAGELGTPIQ